MSINYEPSLGPATGTVAPCVFVTLDRNFDAQYVQSIGGDLPIGVMQEAQKGAPGISGSDSTIAAQSGDKGPRIIGLGNEALITLGGTVSNGNCLKPNNSGQAISAASNDLYGAVALAGGTSGMRIRCIVRPGKA